MNLRTLIPIVTALPMLTAAPIDFSTQVRPILTQRCSGCHGKQQQMGGVRFDRRPAGSIIEPGHSADSLLIRMVTSGKDGKVMPPIGPRLTEAEIGILRAWIDEGAKWPDNDSAAHWSFQPIRRPAVPNVQHKAWARNPIDAFILARLEKERIEPSPEAGPRTLIRRASFDLVGLPPERTEDAYEGLIDRLLASPHYGEKWARHWLDLARYADSDGYEQDGIRPHAWRYRDWVIRALNANMPFDRFTIEQIAGDLLPNPTLEQRTATGFHRNTLTSREGGIDVDQLRDEQVIDRTNTLGTVWLGLTIECARCHDHKYDPISQRDYYQLFAFFNSAEEVNLDAPAPGEVGPYLRRRPEYERKLNELMAKYRVAELQTKWEGELRRAAAHPEERLEWTQNLDYVRVYLDHGHEILMIPPAQRTWKQAHGLTRVFLKSPGPLGSEPDLKRLNFGEAFKIFEDLDREYPQLGEAPVIQEMATPPKTFVHIRGDFRNTGAEATAGTPGALPPLPAGVKRDRLALARWLVSADNPLTARVAVNRIWQEFFGKGLVATSEDFGTRGDAPSHPELLDWLAAEFMSSGWDVKHIQKLIVTSATYRQSSRSRKELEKLDPGNRLLARQSRLRLPAELIRDAALSASGLLNPAIGGASIRPPMPAGALNVAYRARWDESQGPDRYRRGLYIFLQRSVPYPQLITFDAPGSLVTCSRRERSTTPLQALTLLNDPVFFEAAQALALRVLRGAPADLAKRIDYAFDLCFGRPPAPEEREQISRYYHDRRDRPEAAAMPAAAAIDPGPAVGVEHARPCLSPDDSPGQGRVCSTPTAGEAGAWVGVSSILLNLDEFITRE